MVIGALGVGALSVIAAAITWKVVGPPDRSIPCTEELLKPGQVCLETVNEWEKGSFLWVDARPRHLWERNGMEGAILLTDDNEENFDELDAGFMMAVFGDGTPFEKVVIYCNEEGCGSSEAIATHLRNSHAQSLGFEVYVLYGGWKALAAAGRTRGSTQDR